MARHRRVDRPPQRPPHPVLRGPRAVVPGPAVRRAGRRGARPDRRGVRAVDRPLPPARPVRCGRLLVRRDRRHVHPVVCRFDGRLSPRRGHRRPRAARHRRDLPGGDDRPGGRADHRSTGARRGDRRGRRGGRRLAGGVDNRRDHRGRVHRPGGRPARAGGDAGETAPIGSEASADRYSMPHTLVDRPDKRDDEDGR